MEIATLLQSSGIRAGDRVGVLSHPSTDAIAAMLSTAILRCTYVPLDPNYAQGRLEYMIKDTNPSLILHGPGVQFATNQAEKVYRTKFPLTISVSTRHNA